MRRSDPAELVEVVRGLIGTHRGWVNLRPGVADEDRPPEPSGFSRLLSGRGPAVPMATLVVGAAGKPHQIGVEHGSGPKARQRLGDAGVRAPAGSTVQSDHGRRGLVLAVPADTDAAELVDFLFAAAANLSLIPLQATWEAEVFSG